MAYTELGELIAAELKRHKIKRREAAAAMDIADNGLWSRMSGKLDWRLGELEKLAEMLGMKLSTLLRKAGM